MQMGKQADSEKLNHLFVIFNFSNYTVCRTMAFHRHYRAMPAPSFFPGAITGVLP